MIRVLITDDDPFIRESLHMILDLNELIEVVGTCQNGEEAWGFLLNNNDVDLVLMDIRMPVCDGVEGTKRIKQSYPNIAVLILTTFDDDEYVIEALKHGANGYLLKNIPPAQIIEGIRAVHAGNLLIHPDIAKKISGLLQARSQPTIQSADQIMRQQGFTGMEQSIVQKIADGRSNKEIAQELFLSEGTIKNYISVILSKLELRDRTQIAIFYLKH